MNKYKFQEFLQQNGYRWSGYVAENTRCTCETFRNSGDDLDYLDDTYILLGSHYDYDEDDGYIKITGEPLVKYIRHDEIMFRVYLVNHNGKEELEKDLSKEWVRYQALNIEGYSEDTLFFVKCIQDKYPKHIENRKNLLAQEIERITKEANTEIREMEANFALSKMAEETINQVQQERLIKQQIKLGAKDNFKDTKNNDACLQHLTDTFGSRK